MSRVWDAIKRVERERALAGQDKLPTEPKSDDRAASVYVAEVRRRCRERLARAEGPTGVRSR